MIRPMSCAVRIRWHELRWPFDSVEPRAFPRSSSAAMVFKKIQQGSSNSDRMTSGPSTRRSRTPENTRATDPTVFAHHSPSGLGLSMQGFFITQVRRRVLSFHKYMISRRSPSLWRSKSEWLYPTSVIGNPACSGFIALKCICWSFNELKSSTESKLLIPGLEQRDQIGVERFLDQIVSSRLLIDPILPNSLVVGFQLVEESGSVLASLSKVDVIPNSRRTGRANNTRSWNSVNADFQSGLRK